MTTLGGVKPRKIFYGWILVATIFLIVILGYGMRYSFSVFYVEILEEFGWSRADTALIFSLNLLVYGASAAFIGPLIDRLGPRVVVPIGGVILASGLALMSQARELWHFYLFFGLMVAVGYSATGNPSFIPTISHWFVRYRGAAMGVLFAGVVGAPIIAPLAQYFIGLFQWRGAYLALAVLIASIVVPSSILLIRNRPQDLGLLPDGDARNPSPASKELSTPQAQTYVVDQKWASRNWTLTSAMTTYRFWLFFISNLLGGLMINLFFLHQVAHMVDVGFSQAFAASIFGLVGATSIVGNLLGFVSDLIGRERAYTLGMTGALSAILVLIMVKDATNPWMLYLYAIPFGLLWGMATPAGVAAMADVFQGKNFGSINGVLLTGFGIGGAIGPWLGGRLFDAMGNYVLPFFLTIALGATTVAFLWIIAPRKIRLVGGQAQKLLATAPNP